MERIKTIATRDLTKSVKTGGCGECQTSCQSACKVHQYQLNGYNIVLDTCSGSVHVVDDVAYDVIAMYQDHTADQIVSAMMDKYGSRPDVTEEDLRQCIDDVTSLKEAGKLWSPDVYENMAFDFKNRSTVVKALCLHVAHTCNLSCSYCFASQGRYHGDR